ncbi:MAG: ATP-binding protein [Opitutaceae bacterium]|nr:ATP-binding protein [Opitutaceae bacterium]
MSSLLTLAPWLLAAALACILGVTVLRARSRARQQTTELAATAAKLKRLVQAVDSASDAIGIGDMDSNSLFHNKSHIDLFGYTVEHLNAAEEPAALFADKAVARQIHQSIREGRSWHGETDIKDKSGRVFPAFVRADIIRDDAGTPTGIFGVFTDITERRRQEDAIRASEENLRRANLELQAAVEEARRLARAAEAANAAKSAFLATMSHEIRTPLNGVIGMTQLLGDTSLNDDQRECLRTIKLSGEALLIIINDTLDYSKIEAGHVELQQQPYDVADGVEEAVMLIADRARAKGLALTHRVDPAIPRHVIGDAARLRQILINLLSNAIKFTEQGAVALEARLAAAPAGGRCQLLFSVRDTGIGIAKEKQDRLFQRFSQVDDSNTRRYGGTGLGLAISKRLAELMGGSITVESGAGHGSTFTVVIEVGVSGATTPPIKPAAGPTEPPKPQIEIASPSPAPTATVERLASRMPLRVLITDDNPVNQRVAALTMKRFGYACDLVDDGAKAVAAHTRTPYDLILMDVHMPVMDGLEATRRIRALSGASHHPWIVAITAGAFEEDRLNALAAGMNDFLNKPLHAELLKESITRGYQALQATGSTP